MNGFFKYYLSVFEFNVSFCQPKFLGFAFLLEGENLNIQLQKYSPE